MAVTGFHRKHAMRVLRGGLAKRPSAPRPERRIYLLERLQAEYPGAYSDRLLRTLQRRVTIWRNEIAHAMVFGAMQSAPAESQLAAAARS